MDFFIFYFSLKSISIYIVSQLTQKLPGINGGDLPKGGESKNNSVDTLKMRMSPMRTKETMRCTANNFLGSATHEFHVTVKYISVLIYFSIKEAVICIVHLNEYIYISE